MISINLSEEDVRNCTWRLAEITPHYRRWIGHGTHPVTGVEITVQKTEFLAEDDLVARNADERNEADGRRWGHGLGAEKGGNMPFVKVASIPLNKFFAELAPGLREGDRDHARWWLNNERNQPFRTRNGRV